VGEVRKGKKIQQPVYRYFFTREIFWEK